MKASRTFPALLAIPAALVLAGCGNHGMFRDRGNDYLKAEVGKPLVYPEGIRPIPSQELYPVPDVDNRRRLVAGEKPVTEIPPPPQVVALDAPAAGPEPVADTGTANRIPEAKVSLTRDGNDYPVLMLDLAFDRAWQVIGDALRGIGSVKVDDIDRDRAVYYVVLDGKRSSAGEPYELKLNYTANGIQVALQVDENAMAPKELSEPLMQQLKDGILK